MINPSKSFSFLGETETKHLRCWPTPASRAPGRPGAPCRDAGAAKPISWGFHQQKLPKNSNFMYFST